VIQGFKTAQSQGYGLLFTSMLLQGFTMIFAFKSGVFLKAGLFPKALA